MQRLARFLTSRGHSVHWVAGWFPGCEGLPPELGLRMTFVGKASLLRSARYALVVLSRLAEFSSDADVIVEDFSPYAPTFSFLARPPAALQIQNHFGTAFLRRHPLLSPALWLIEKIYPRFFRHRIFVGTALLRRHKNRGALIPQGVESTALTLPSTSGDYIAFLGRLDFNQKGLDLLLKAAALTGLPVRIAGQGPGLERLQAALSGLPHVKHVGHLDEESKFRFLAESRFVVLPSRFEGEPVSMTEAAACGKGVLVSNIPELAYTVQNGFGQAFQKGNAADLARRMEALWKNPEILRDMGKHGRAFAKTRTWEEIGHQFESHLLNLISPTTPWRRTWRGWRRLLFPRLILPRRGQLPLGWAIHYALAVLVLLLFPLKALLRAWRRKDSAPVSRRAVFVSRAHLGDFLMSVPALLAFRDAFPGCHVTVALQQRYHDSLDLHAALDAVLEPPEESLPFLSQVRAWTALFRAGGYDTAIFHRITRPDLPALLAAFLCGIPRRVGGADKGTQALLTHAYFPEGRGRVAQYHLNLIAAFAGTTAGPLRWPELVAPVPPPRRYDVVLVPFAQHSKVWTEEGWRALFDHLRARGLSAALVGSAGQREAAEALRAAHPEIANLAGKTDLPGLFRLIGAARAVAGVDTGARHVAAALGVPCVVLGHGREHRQLMGAYAPGERYLVTEVPCAPCGAEPCPLGHVGCIRRTPAAAVVAALDSLLPL